MTLELSAEEIVTKLLSSNQIIKNQKEKSFISDKKSLGDYLSNKKHSPYYNEENSWENSKYTFIKTKWII